MVSAVVQSAESFVPLVSLRQRLLLAYMLCCSEFFWTDLEPLSLGIACFSLGNFQMVLSQFSLSCLSLALSFCLPSVLFFFFFFNLPSILIYVVAAPYIHACLHMHVFLKSILEPSAHFILVPFIDQFPEQNLENRLCCYFLSVKVISPNVTWTHWFLELAFCSCLLDAKHIGIIQNF